MIQKLLFSESSSFGVSTKNRVSNTEFKKSLFDLPEFISLIFKWQELRPPLLESDMNLELLILLTMGEIEEIDEESQLEGSEKYSLKRKVIEVGDGGFFIASLQRLLCMQGHSINYNDVVASANGQAGGSNGLEKMREVTGNISEQSLNKDLKYLWILWVSYIINMKFPVAPNEVLLNYVFPKNNGNYVESLLSSNPLFDEAFDGVEMTKGEKISYYEHYRKATRIIRSFIFKYVDPSIKDTGLKPEHYHPYEMFIFNFMHFRGTGLKPSDALTMLEDQLHRDWKIPRQNSSYSNEILEVNTLFEEAYGRKMSYEETLDYYRHAEEAMKIIYEYVARINPDVRNKKGRGLSLRLYLKYEQFIYNFKEMPGINLSSHEALSMLNDNLNDSGSHLLKPVDKIPLSSV